MFWGPETFPPPETCPLTLESSRKSNTDAENTQTLKPVEQVLKDAKVKKNEINDIVLVGGSTRIPKYVLSESR